MPENLPPWWEGLPGFEELGDDTTGEAFLENWRTHLSLIEKERAAKRKTGLSAEQLYAAYLREAVRSEQDGLWTGWDSVDAALDRPILPGEVVIIGARTGVGKSWIAQQWTENAVTRNLNHRIAFISMEMSYWQLGERYAAHALGRNPARVTEDVKRGEVAISDLTEGTVGVERWWFYERSISVGEIQDVVDSAAESLGAPPTIVVLDYLGLLAGKGNLYERTSENARALKDAAKATNTIILACAQISRGVGGSGEEEPSLAGMRDSGAIEEAADRAFLFWQVPATDDEIMCRLAKNRYGQRSGRIRLRFDRAMRLTEAEGTDLYEVRDKSDIPF